MPVLYKGFFSGFVDFYTVFPGIMVIEPGVMVKRDVPFPIY